MRITRLVLTCVLLATTAAGSLSAQVTQPPAAVPVERDSTQPDSAQRPEPVHLNRGVVRIANDYMLPANHTIPFITVIVGDVTIEGEVNGDVAVTVGSARLASTAVINGSLVVVGGSATIAEGALIRHDLVVVGGTTQAPVGFSPRGEYVVVGSAWLGEALQDVMPWLTRGLLLGRPIVPDLAWVWAVVGILFFVYLVLNTVFDRPVGAAADILSERPLSAFVTGLLVLVLSVPALAILAATVIGLVVVPFLLCALVIAGLVGKTAVCRAIGRTIVRPQEGETRFQAFAAFLLGFALLVGIYMVPLLGFVTWALTTVLGFGAASVTFRSYLRRERPAPAPAPAAAAVAGQTVASDASLVSSEPVPPPAAPGAAATEVAPPHAFTQGLARFPRATFLDRVAAFALDCVLVAIANAFLDISNDGGPFFLLLLAYHIAFWAWKGTTLGGIITNLRVVRTDGRELQFADAMVRGLSSVFSIAALGIGCFWMLQDSERQMWHDKIAGTLVVKVPRDLVMP